jgi:hypothetical protein
MLEHCQQNLSSNVARTKNIEKKIQQQFFLDSVHPHLVYLFHSLCVCVEFMLRYFVCWTQSFRFRRKFITITPQFSAKCIECAESRETKHAGAAKLNLLTNSHKQLSAM